MSTLEFRPRPVLLGLLLASAALSTTAPARADAAPSDKAAAETLFDEARALMKSGQYDAACPKLADSQRLDPGIGTLLYLASCYEKTGRLATAWVTFREAAGAAHLAGQADREKTATLRANALAPLLPRLTLEPSVERGDPEILRDGVPVAKSLWNTAVPVDPGPHTIEARLAGHVSRTFSIQLAKGEARTLPIPALERSDSPPETPAVEASPRSAPAAAEAPPPRVDGGPSPLRRISPYAAAGVGVAAVAVGSVFGLRAFSAASDVEAACPSGPCSAAVRAQADESKSDGNVATALFAVGAVGIATAVVLWATMPKAAGRAVTATGSGIALGF